MTKAKAKTRSKGDATASELISRYIAEHDDWRGQMLARIRNVFHEAEIDEPALKKLIQSAVRYNASRSE